MTGLNLLIVDGNEDFHQALEKSLQASYAVYHSDNGKHALEIAKTLNPDVIVLALMLTELDGISLLHAIRALGMHPAILVATRMYTHYVFEAAEELGIEYMIRKPCDPAAVAQRLNDLSHRLRFPNPQTIDPATYVSERLAILGFSSRHIGLDYVREAVLLKYRNKRLAITKDLYPSVAEICGTTSILVERSMRTAVNAAWEQNKEKWRELYPKIISNDRLRPSNGVLVALLAEDLRAKKPLPEDEEP